MAARVEAAQQADEQPRPHHALRDAQRVVGAVVAGKAVEVGPWPWHRAGGRADRKAQGQQGEDEAPRTTCRVRAHGPRAQVAHGQADQQQQIELVHEEAARPRGEVECGKQGGHDERGRQRAPPDGRATSHQQHRRHGGSGGAGCEVQPRRQQRHPQQHGGARRATRRRHAGSFRTQSRIHCHGIDVCERWPTPSVDHLHEGPADGCRDADVGRVGVQPGEPQLAGLEHRARCRAPQRRDRGRSLPGPGQHAHRKVHQRHVDQAGQRVRLGGVVVVVEGNKPQFLPAGRRGFHPLPVQCEPAGDARQQQHVGRSPHAADTRQRRAQALAAPAFAPPPQRQPGGDAEHARQHRSALRDAGVKHHLRTFNAQPDGQAHQRGPHPPRRTATRRTLAEQQPERHRQQHLHAQLQGDDEGAAVLPGEPPAEMVGGKLLLDLDPRDQHVVGEQAVGQVRCGVSVQAMGREPARSRVLHDGPGHPPSMARQRQQGADNAADALGHQVVHRNRAWREEDLRELDPDRQHHAQHDRNSQRRDAPRAAPQPPPRGQEPERRVQHAVGDPVGARLHAQMQKRHPAKALPGVDERHEMEVQRHQAAVDDEARISEQQGRYGRGRRHRQVRALRDAQPALPRQRSKPGVSARAGPRASETLGGYPPVGERRLVQGHATEPLRMVAPVMVVLPGDTCWNV